MARRGIPLSSLPAGRDESFIPSYLYTDEPAEIAKDLKMKYASTGFGARASPHGEPLRARAEHASPALQVSARPLGKASPGGESPRNWAGPTLPELESTSRSGEAPRPVSKSATRSGEAPYPVGEEAAKPGEACPALGVTGVDLGKSLRGLGRGVRSSLLQAFTNKREGPLLRIQRWRRTVRRPAAL